jgi:hypothetical protein
MKRVRSQPRRFVLDQLLGAGTYNCAYYVLEDGTVLRIGFLPANDRTTTTIVKRGLEMVHVFQSFRHMLGPSLLQEVSKYHIIKAGDLHKYVEGDLCPSILKNNIDNNLDEFGLQHIEFLSGGEFKHDSLKEKKIVFNQRELCFVTFSLLWFFAMSQQLFAFRHHDLKGTNMMIRVTPDVKEYVFEINNPTGSKKYYRFFSPYVPVVIDYDFASVYTTKDESSRNSGGTEYTRSPDALLYSLYGEAYKTFDFTYNPNGYDYWSLGISLFEIRGDFYVGIHQLFDVESKEFATYMVGTKFLPSRVTKSFLQYFFYGLCFAAAVSKEPSSFKPPRALYGGIVDVVTDEKWNAWETKVRDSNDFKAVQDVFKHRFPSRLRAIVRQLLSLDPTLRNANNKPMDLIVKSKFFKNNKFKKERGEKLASFKGTNQVLVSDKTLLKNDESNIRGISFLEGKVCATCSVNADSTATFYLCECCAQVFCGRGCQSKKH